MNIQTLPDKTYAILLSGGLDSAFLLYLVVSNNPTVDIQPYTIPKTDGAIEYANAVIDHLNTKFGWSIPQTISVGDPSAHHRMQSVIAADEIRDVHEKDFLFAGVTQNPEELDSLPYAPERTKEPQDPRVLLPFVQMTKDQALQLMFDLDQGDLASVTHSCTESSGTPCTNCWACIERAWAFDKIGQTDTGITDTL
jgi:7-cyano-7-deazaguanine synthase in queuosine biosynthesis